jgi:eukaryotic-like serine/threonine-protein kinase
VPAVRYDARASVHVRLEAEGLADIGSVLSGRYRLVELLARGGMATIYRARDLQLERDVAVKVLRPEYGRDPDFLSRFRHEAQAAGGLNDPGIVAVYDFGQDEERDPYIVMELVDGKDLGSIVRENGPLPPRQAARIAASIARALAVAHAHGLVHRDVKPSNVLISSDGRVKVVDFGIARAVAEAQVTLPGTTLGSVHYFSPEQARGEPTTAASDIYSLGIVLFEMLTGTRPWEGDSAAAVAVARLTGPVPIPSDRRAGIPPSLEAIDRKALALDPEDRFSSAAAMADALDSFLAEGSAHLSPAAGAAAAGAAAGMAAAGVAGLAASDLEATAPAPVSGVASPGRVASTPYTPEPPAPYSGSGAPAGTEQDHGVSPWTWIAGAVGIIVLVFVGFAVFRLLSGGGAAASPSPSPAQAQVPSLVGLPVQQAAQVAQSAGFTVSQDLFTPSNSGAVGSVLSQDPPAGTLAPQGTDIKLTIVSGADVAPIPDVTGQKEADAINALTTAGFKIGTRSDDYSATIPVGAVISTDPKAGLQVTTGTYVNYVVSKGPQPSPSPSPTPTPPPSPSPSPPPPSPSPSPPPPSPSPSPPPPSPSPS